MTPTTQKYIEMSKEFEKLLTKTVEIPLTENGISMPPYTTHSDVSITDINSHILQTVIAVLEAELAEIGENVPKMGYSKLLSGTGMARQVAMITNTERNRLRTSLTQSIEELKKLQCN